MATNITTGFIIDKQKFKDNDMIFTILTRDGKFSFIALGVRKINSKNRTSLELGNKVEIEFFKARLANKLSKLKKSSLLFQPPLELADTALVIIRMSNLIRNIDISSDGIYKAIDESTIYMGEDYNHLILTYILAAALGDLGIKPVIDKCFVCNRKDNIVDFSIFNGGFLCNLHSDNKLSLGELKGWKNLFISFNKYKLTPPDINKFIFEKVKETLNKYTHFK